MIRGTSNLFCHHGVYMVHFTLPAAVFEGCTEKGLRGIQGFE